jgi:hypothetical protein
MAERVEHRDAQIGWGTLLTSHPSWIIDFAGDQTYHLGDGNPLGACKQPYSRPLSA